MQITTKIGCKIVCDYCPQDKLIRQYKSRSGTFNLSFEDFKTCVDKIPLDVGIEFGGMSEPSLNPECTRMLLYAYDTGHKILVKTTLVGMTEKDIESIETVPFRLFQVHLPSKQGHEKIPVDEEYQSVLDRITKSRINVLYHFHGNKLNPEVESLLNSNGRTTSRWALHRRAGLMEVKHKSRLPKRRGVIACKMHMRSNILLPNGDVLLCSNDYGMKHVLGNLKASGYDSLFYGEEYEKVIKGQTDESLDILCRHCDNFCININSTAKVKNWRYNLDRYVYHMKNKGSSFFQPKIIQKAILSLTKRTHSALEQRRGK